MQGYVNPHFVSYQPFFRLRAIPWYKTVISQTIKEYLLLNICLGPVVVRKWMLQPFLQCATLPNTFLHLRCILACTMTSPPFWSLDLYCTSYCRNRSALTNDCVYCKYKSYYENGVEAQTPSHPADESLFPRFLHFSRFWSFWARWWSELAQKIPCCSISELLSIIDCKS